MVVMQGVGLPVCLPLQPVQVGLQKRHALSLPPAVLLQWSLSEAAEVLLRRAVMAARLEVVVVVLLLLVVRKGVALPLRPRLKSMLVVLVALVLMVVRKGVALPLRLCLQLLLFVRKRAALPLYLLLHLVVLELLRPLLKQIHAQAPQRQTSSLPLPYPTRCLQHQAVCVQPGSGRTPPHQLQHVLHHFLHAPARLLLLPAVP
mmetsp:Transcript_25962/g.66942  ORF Transcript_25962/g.66942 Transcript_25962/m.66942 type:complete len:203 (-) Transcript_25962:1720-2328(-)